MRFRSEIEKEMRCAVSPPLLRFLRTGFYARIDSSRSFLFLSILAPWKFVTDCASNRIAKRMACWCLRSSFRRLRVCSWDMEVMGRYHIWGKGLFDMGEGSGL
jgi:hypothetical protein